MADFNASPEWWDQVQERMLHPDPKPLVIVREAAVSQGSLEYWVLMALGVGVIAFGAWMLWSKRGGGMPKLSTTPLVLTVAVSFLTDFIITGGGVISGGMIGQKEIAAPSEGVWILGVILGLMAASRRIQALFQLSPVQETPQPPGPPAVGGHYELHDGKWVWIQNQP